MTDIRPLRLGVVPYLNVLPLLEGLDAVYPRHHWVQATPRQLAEQLDAGEIDVAVVSVFEGLRQAGRWGMVPGAAIGSDGPVRSVALFARSPLDQVRRVLLDRASLTSIHLARILATNRLAPGVSWELAEAPLAPDFHWQGDALHDAWVAIGDTALAWEHAFPHRLDLGAAWQEDTGLPFVYAAWWTRPGLQLTAAEQGAFAEARRRGTANIDRIVERLNPADLTPYGGVAGVRSYLSDSIRYTLGERERAGLERFRFLLDQAGFLGPIPSAAPFR